MLVDGFGNSNTKDIIIIGTTNDNSVNAYNESITAFSEETKMINDTNNNTNNNKNNNGTHATDRTFDSDLDIIAIKKRKLTGKNSHQFQIPNN